MAIIAFYSNETKETGQTLSLAAVTAYMSIEHNYKTLVVSTAFNDLTLENCFWKYDKIRVSGTIQNSKNLGLTSGVEGLIKVLSSNRSSDEIVKNYARVVLKDRLDILLAPATKSYQEYSQMTSFYTNILQIANKYYDMVFIDVSKTIPRNDITTILQMSNLVVMNLTQNLQTINDFMQLKEKNDFYQRKNVMLAIGKYDRFSKYNNKNITRYLKEKKLISVIPYNTLFFEACSEGQIIEYLLRIRNITDEMDRNITFSKETKKFSDSIIYRLQELQMKI